MSFCRCMNFHCPLNFFVFKKTIETKCFLCHNRLCWFCKDCGNYFDFRLTEKDHKNGNNFCQESLKFRKKEKQIRIFFIKDDGKTEILLYDQTQEIEEIYKNGITKIDGERLYYSPIETTEITYNQNLLPKDKKIVDFLQDGDFIQTSKAFFEKRLLISLICKLKSPDYFNEPWIIPSNTLDYIYQLYSTVNINSLSSYKKELSDLGNLELNTRFLYSNCLNQFFNTDQNLALTLISFFYEISETNLDLFRKNTSPFFTVGILSENRVIYIRRILFTNNQNYYYFFIIQEGILEIGFSYHFTYKETIDKYYTKLKLLCEGLSLKNIIQEPERKAFVLKFNL